jgi:hypothetical protein
MEVLSAEILNQPEEEYYVSLALNVELAKNRELATPLPSSQQPD